jgi:zinc-ribbon domain
MALVKCRECGNEVSIEAKTCPKCGARTRKTIGIANIIGVIALLIILFWFFFGGGNEQQAKQNWDKIKLQVATDAVAEYDLAKKGGNLRDMCVQAEVVAAAYLQAHQEAKYLAWKDTEKADCKAAEGHS